jgi:hypothetical protein
VYASRENEQGINENAMKTMMDSKRKDGMKRTLCISISALFLAATMTAMPLPGEAQVKTPIPKKQIQKAPLPPISKDKLKMMTCPDPAAHRIDFQIVSKKDKFHGNVKIIGVVKNVGTAAFETGPNQQSANLYEMVPGGTPKLVASQKFQNLATGQEAMVAYERAWSTSVEFPPAYRLTILYDPDIYIDGNRKNDDCGKANNSLERRGGDINDMFGR